MHNFARIRMNIADLMLAVFVFACAAITLSACNTTAGVGQDCGPAPTR
jgi:predicted small secreted protein